MRILYALAASALSIPMAFAAPAPAAAMAAPANVAAVDQDRRDYRGHRDRDYNRDRRAQQRRYQDRRDWRGYRNYDYNRLPRGTNAYYADEYYRDGRYYKERRLTRNDRIYRGRDNRYYCRRSDGTTGLIVGGVAGGLFGNAIAGGGNATLGTLLGAAAGAALGNSVDRGNIRCR